MTDTTPGTAESLRERMVTELLDAGAITDPRIEEAFRAVPREVFCPPGTPLEQPYVIHDKVRTRFDADGKTLSSLSAPILHARNLAQSQIEPGMRVLEIGSGGPLAAVLAHVVGPDGQVVTVDIDEGVTARTRSGLEHLGLTDRVEVLTADAGLPLERGVYDRIIVTVAARTIPQVWLDQLGDDGILVIPFQIAPNSQRVLGFHRHDDRLAAQSVVIGGFVPMQGVDHYEEPAVGLTGPSGGAVTFRFDNAVPAGFAVTDDVLASDPVEAWSGVTYANGQQWVDLLTWILVQPGGCQVDAADRTDLGNAKAFFPAIVDGASFVALATRPVPDAERTELGAVAKGPEAARLAQRLIDAVGAHDADHCGSEPLFQWWPGPKPPKDVPPSVTLLPRPHGTLTISWPQTMPDRRRFQGSESKEHAR